MPTILETIGEYDEDLLLMIAESWGIEPQNNPPQNTAKFIASQISLATNVEEFLKSMPEPETSALSKIASLRGKFGWHQFTREFGELREMGAGKRKRERPDIHPSSITESLYYKGFIGKAFFDASGGPREFAYIPDEFLPFINHGKNLSFIDQIKPGKAQNLAKKFLTNEFIIDHACTLLAAIRSDIDLDQLSFTRPNIDLKIMFDLLKEAKLLNSKHSINPDQVKHFLEAPRGQALSILFEAWRNSQIINELTLLSGLDLDGKPPIKPQAAREFLLGLIRYFPNPDWINIEEFIQAIHQMHPDFLRTGGEYEAWKIKDISTGEFLCGFEHWHDIEGQYLRTMINEPLFWFGIVDLGKSEDQRLPPFFRKSRWADDLFDQSPLQVPIIEKQEFVIDKNASLVVDRNFRRDVRYQLARFCEWSAQKGNRFHYRISSKSLKRIKEQGLTEKQLLSIIQRHARKPLPTNILKALERWEIHQAEAKIFNDILISVDSPTILDRLLTSPVKKYIHARLNPLTAQVDQKGIQYLYIALLEMGIFADISIH